MNSENKIANYVHYQRADCITLMLDAFSEDRIDQNIELGKIYEVRFVGELGVPITVTGTFIGCLVEGTWGKYLNLVDSKTGYTWQIYTGNGNEDRGIISMIDRTEPKPLRPMWHGSQNGDIWELAHQSVGGKPVYVTLGDFQVK